MKALFIINSLGIGGAENLITSMILKLKDRNNFYIDILVLNSDQSINMEMLNKEQINIIKSPYKNIYDPRNIFIIKYIFDNNKYNIVHVNLFPSLYWAALAKIMTWSNINMIYTEHSTNNRRRSKRIFRYFDRFIYKKYNKIISISEGCYYNLNRWLGKGFIENHYIINNGIDISRFKNLQFNKEDRNRFYEKINYKPGDILICMVSNFNDAKDQNTVINSISTLPDNYKLILVGSGKNYEKTKKYIEKCKLVNRVTLLGYQKDIPQILSFIDLGVQSSYWEGFGLAAVEIMASGKPILGTNVEGLNEIIPKENLFEIGDYETLSKKILKITTDEDIYNENVRVSEVLSNMYSIEETVKKYVQKYIDII